MQRKSRLPEQLVGPRASRLARGVETDAGLAEVTYPETFLARLYAGFGRAKAFGNGLMLIRRA